jgi:hypothetical protein
MGPGPGAAFSRPMGNVRISPKLLWMRPYLELAYAFLPKGKSVVLLGHRGIGTKRDKTADAELFSYDDKKYRVYIRTMYHPRYLKRPTPWSKIDLLKMLAHELAHMVSWEHTPAHARLEAILTIEFMARLEAEGYVSEELELSKDDASN